MYKRQVLELEIEIGKKIYVTVGDGSLIMIFLHEIDVKLGKESFKATIGFSKQLGIGFNIIGRKDFFERFKVCFSERERIVEFLGIDG